MTAFLAGFLAGGLLVPVVGALLLWLVYREMDLEGEDE